MKDPASTVQKSVLSAMFLSLALLLPFLTGQAQISGEMFLPMHIPVLLCGFFCGGRYGMVVGAVAPLLRFALFRMPPLLFPLPIGAAMIPELAVYGLMTGILFKVLPKKRVYIILNLIITMLSGRLIWGVVMFVFSKVLVSVEFSINMFLAGVFTTALPGIIIQLVLIPILVISIKGRRLQ